AMAAIDVREGDEVVLPAITFAATANAVLYQGATPVFVDVEEDTLLIDSASAAAVISEQTKALVGVDYGGQPCDVTSLRAVAQSSDAWTVVDAAHSLGATLNSQPAPASADLATFCFHRVK